MKKIIFVLLTLAYQFNANANATEQCDADMLGSIYKITDDSDSTQTLELWRYQNQVAYIYPHKAQVELWNRTANGKSRLIRYFQKYNKGIEYQAIELREQQSWLAKYQLIDDSQLAVMTLGATRGQGCDIEQDYHLESKNGHVGLTWLPKYKILKTLIKKKHDKIQRWQLTKLITEQQNVQSQFVLWDSYQTTDYADVGDNESDPFLAKMIHQGF